MIDDLSRGSLDNLVSALDQGARFAQTDVRDAALADHFRAFGPEVVMHLAAQADVRESISDPALDASCNIVGSINVFNAAHLTGARRVVNTSTGGAIYGDAEIMPTPETLSAEPLSPYGLSKRVAEQYAHWFRLARGLDVVTLRYGNVYGPRQDPQGDAGVIARFCSRALAGRRPTVYGDGRQTRDFVFVADIAASNLAVARVGRLEHAEYNIGTGTEVSVLELVDAVAAAARVDSSRFVPEFLPARTGEVRRSCLDVRRARSEMGLQPPTELAEGLRRTLGWVGSSLGITAG